MDMTAIDGDSKLELSRKVYAAFADPKRLDVAGNGGAIAVTLATLSDIRDVSNVANKSCTFDGHQSTSARIRGSHLGSHVRCFLPIVFLDSILATMMYDVVGVSMGVRKCCISSWTCWVLVPYASVSKLLEICLLLYFGVI